LGIAVTTLPVRTDHCMCPAASHATLMIILILIIRFV